MKTIRTLTMTLGLMLLPLCAGAQMKTVHAKWNYQADEFTAGFRLYHENELACTVNSPTAVSANCEVDVAYGPTWFTLTAFLEDGTESDHSAPLAYTFSSTVDANFTSSIQSGIVPLTVNFDASSSTGPIVSYDWEFGDGSQNGSGQSVSHNYTEPGNYNVVLTVMDSNGESDKKNLTINVTPAVGKVAPVAVLYASKGVGEAPLLVDFDASKSKDIDGKIVSYAWDFGDGKSLTGMKVTHTYTTPGTYHPTVTVTDDSGLSDKVSTPILVQPASDDNIAPSAVIKAKVTQGSAPLKLVFDGSKSSDKDGSIIAYKWSFGDGKTASGKVASHTYTEAGNYTVTLTVMDNKGKNSNPAMIKIKVKKNGEKPNILPIIEYLLITSKDRSRP